MKRILLIDDDKDISELIQVILGDQYEVECQADHHNIPAKLQSFAPHLVLLDNSVRIKHDTDMMSEFRGEGEQNSVPVVLFSAQYDIEQISTAINADGYLTKPFNLVELYTCINRLIA